MKHYTLGFVFNSELNEVLLIHKNRPEWQKGKINGPGGKVEPDEEPKACISREIREETGLSIPIHEWTAVGEMNHVEWNVQLFAVSYKGKKYDVQSLTDEKLEWFPTEKIPANVIPNLHWLIPLCKDKLAGREVSVIRVEYT